MTKQVDIAGFAGPRLSRVKDTFAANFADDDFPELGARFAAFQDGEAIVDIRGGSVDRKQERPWTAETLACVYSSGKAVVALLVARAVSDGRLDYDAPVAAVWPEFAAAGKDRITIAEALSHQGGLCGFPDEMDAADWLDWAKIAGRLAAMAPLWPPGSANGYHPQTAGFIAGELLRRSDGRSVGAILREDYFQARGLDLHCGLGPDLAGRTAFMPKPPRPPDLGELNRYKEAAFLKPWSAPARVAREDWMAAELPASNMHGTAAALARIVQPLACGGRDPGGSDLDPAAVKAALAPRISGDDLVLPFRLTWAAGLMANTDGFLGPSQTAMGHYGFGGSCVVVDPARRLSAAYVMNRMSPHLVGDPRPIRLLNALYEAL